MLDAMKSVEMATLLLEQHALSFAFPVKGMMLKHWTAEPLVKEIFNVQREYQQALAAVKTARAKTAPERRKVQDYWIGRLEYGIDYIEAAGLLHQAALADSQGRRQVALQQTERALSKARSGIEAYAGVALDQSDRGAIATMGEFVCRPLVAKVEELRREK
jgi:hypothetical protein